MADLPPPSQEQAPPADLAPDVAVVAHEPAVVVTNPAPPPDASEGNKADVSAPASGEPQDEHGPGEALKGCKVRKLFGKKYYFGEVTKYDPENHWYKVAYDDGDGEELTYLELKKWLAPETKKRGRKSEGDESEAKWQNPRRSSRKRSSMEVNVDLTRADSKRSRKPKRSEQIATAELSIMPPVEDEASAGDLIGTVIVRPSGRGKISDYDPNTKLFKALFEDGHEEDIGWGEAKSAKDPGALAAISLEGNVVVKALEGTSRRLRRERAPRPVPESAGEGADGLMHPALADSRGYLAQHAENVRFHAWGEVVEFDQSVCPVLQAALQLPSAPIIRLAASQHHLAAQTSADEVWVWRSKHGNLQAQCGEWEFIAELHKQSILTVGIAGADLDRPSSGYLPGEEDQIPDPFYLAALSNVGQDYIFQGSRHREPIPTLGEQLPSLATLLKLHHMFQAGVGRIVQVSLGTVRGPDEPPFVGYITETDRVYMRSANESHIEEVNLVKGFSGKPLKIQCGRPNYAIFMTDNGRAWTWHRGGKQVGSICQSPPDALEDHVIIDVGCWGDCYLALSNKGIVHEWKHGSAGTTMSHITPDDPLRKIVMGAGMWAGISQRMRLHTVRSGYTSSSSSSGGIPSTSSGAASGSGSASNEPATPFGRDEDASDANTMVTALGATRVIDLLCVPGSLITVGTDEPQGPAA